MKLAFSTLGCPDWSFDAVVRNAAQLGFDGVELRGIRSELRCERLACFQPEQLAQTQALLRENQIALCSLDTSAAFDSREDTAASLAEGLAAVRLCELLQIPAIRVFGDQLHGDAAAEIRRVSEGLRVLCAEAGGRVQVLLETHGDFCTAETIGSVLDDLSGFPHFGILWDVEHTHRIYGPLWREFYLACRTRIRQIHVKDIRRGRPCPCGTGEIPLSDIVKTLLRDGFDGYFSLEWEKRWNPRLEPPETVFPAYVSYLRSLSQGRR